ncbi:MAG: hypothetical protein K9I71_11945 [Ignavibacteriales bacterium]|nr:hypothetical protein [Ignavibacteriales bacterium]MCF8316833.1 hypothetical protein [Ignavibacteriales bacterium]MCF8438409.1 hypothetical protein [Ignavibacteriales bacterium]
MYKLFLLALVFFHANFYSQNKIVDANIGIIVESDDNQRILKKNDFITGSEKFRVKIDANSEMLTYVIYSDAQETIILNTEGKGAILKKDSSITLPAPNELYTITGTEKATITIICSAESIPEIEKITRDGKLPPESWSKFINSFYSKNISIINNTAEKSIPLAGNRRGETLTIRNFRGASIILRKYEITFKK